MSAPGSRRGTRRGSVGIKLSDIKDPSLRASIERQIAVQVAHNMLVGSALKTWNKSRRVILESPKKRIKQSSKPTMNNLEQEFYDRHSSKCLKFPMLSQRLTFVLANGVKYTPDFFCFDFQAHVMESGLLHYATGGPTAWEVKGRKAWDDAVVKLKVAASVYPQIAWWLVWKDKTGWRWQRVMS